MSHPNRGRTKTPDSNPDPADIRASRESAGLTQKQASALIHGTERAWQDYEAGARRLHPGLWELFQIKIATRGTLTLADDKPAYQAPETQKAAPPAK